MNPRTGFCYDTPVAMPLPRNVLMTLILLEDSSRSICFSDRIDRNQQRSLRHTVSLNVLGQSGDCAYEMLLGGFNSSR